MAKKAAKQRVLNTVYNTEPNKAKYYKIYESDEWGFERIVFTYNKRTALSYMKERTAYLKKHDLNCAIFLLSLVVEGDNDTGVDTKYSFFND